MRNDNVLFVSSSYILHAITFLERKGIATEGYCAKSNINKDYLEKQHVFLPFQQVRAFYTSVIIGESLLELGLMLGSEYTITSHGLAGMAAISQRTFYECLTVCAQLLSFRFPAISASIIEGDTHFGLRLEEVVPLKDGMPFSMEMAALVVFGIDRMLFPNGEKGQFRFGYQSPEYAALYAEYFDGEVEFDCEFNEVLFPNNRKEKVLSYHDPVNSTLFLEGFLKEVPFVNRDNIYKKILSVLQASDGKLFDQEKVSDLLSLSPRSLRRKLSESDTTFQGLVNVVKRKYAIHYLVHTSMTITEISAFLYFNDSSHFTKAFKSWVGMSPSDYRGLKRRSVVDNSHTTLDF